MEEVLANNMSDKVLTKYTKNSYKSKKKKKHNKQLNNGQRTLTFFQNQHTDGWPTGPCKDAQPR